MCRVFVTICVLTIFTATAASAGLNPAAKAAIHVLPHDSGRTCTKNFPSVTGCHDIETTYSGCGDVDFFPVFFDLIEYQGIEYGIEWPGFETCAFTSCSDLTVGSIVNTGDGIAHTWTSCMTEPVAITGWGWLGAADYGSICLVPHPEGGAISVGDCSGLMDEVSTTFCAGICGRVGDEPCPPEDLEPLDLNITNGLGGQCACRSQDETFTFFITYGNTANSYSVENVVLASSVPQGIVLEYISGGVYDETRDAIVWDVGTLEPGEEGAVDVIMWVYYTTPAGTMVVDSCEIVGDGTPVSEAADSVRVCGEGDFVPLVILKANNMSDSCQVAGGRVSYLIRCSNPPANCFLRDGYVIDYLAPETIHVSNSHNGVYDPIEHKVTWHYSSIFRGEYIEKEVVVQIAPGVPPGTPIINRCEFTAESILASEAFDTVLVCENQLAAFRLSKGVSPSGSCVPKGTNLNYTLSYTNINGAEVHGVSFVDYLPAETDFVSATGSGVYDADARTVTWELGTVPADYSGSEVLVARIRADAESWRTFSNYCEISGDGVGTTTKSVGVTACGAVGNTCAKVGVHLEPHASRTCSKNFPAITRCQDITYETDSTEVDAFPVFLDLEEYQGFEYGLSWPGTNTCAFTSCSDLRIGTIQEPGDGISHAWYSCQPGPIGVPGWAWIEEGVAGQICVVGHPMAWVISIGDCQDVPRLDQPIKTYCAGIAGAEGENPCGYPTNVEPTTWGEIKAMFK